jgi:hypothetical protein
MTVTGRVLSPLFFALFSGAVIVRLFFSLLPGGEKHLDGDRSTVFCTVTSQRDHQARSLAVRFF